MISGFCFRLPLFLDQFLGGRSVEENGGFYFVPPLSGRFGPYGCSDARGAIIGMTRFTNKGHLARAVLEAIAYQTRDILDAMRRDSDLTLKAIKVDGEMVQNDLLMSFQADILGEPIAQQKICEISALGAAYAAGLATGFWDGLEDLRDNWQINKAWQPHMPAETRQRLYSGWLKAVKTVEWID